MQVAKTVVQLAKDKEEITQQDLRKLSFCFGDDEVVLTCLVYYCTHMGKVKGEMQLSHEKIFFEPIKCDENNKFGSSLRQFQVAIDMGDVISCNRR